MPLTYLRAVRHFALCVWLAAIATSQAQETPSTIPAPSTSRRPLFTAEEINRAWVLEAERQAGRESYIRANADDDVIVLAPYIVDGDSSLVLARLRRELERQVFAPPQAHSVTPFAWRPREFRRKSDLAFFRGPSPGAPRDRPDTVDWLGLSLGIMTAVRDKRAGEIFRAPPDLVNDR